VLLRLTSADSCGLIFCSFFRSAKQFLRGPVNICTATSDEWTFSKSTTSERYSYIFVPPVPVRKGEVHPTMAKLIKTLFEWFSRSLIQSLDERVMFGQLNHSSVHFAGLMWAHFLGLRGPAEVTLHLNSHSIVCNLIAITPQAARDGFQVSEFSGQASLALIPPPKLEPFASSRWRKTSSV
jgi:hypothetical protein